MLEMREYQKRIVRNTMLAVDEGHKHILIESPTGSGKTVCGHLIAQQLFEKFGYRIGWTAMRRHLLAQAEADNARLVGFPHIRYFSTFDSNPPLDIDVLFVDEAHHTASETATNLYNMIKPKITIGTTATPFRTDRMKLCYSRTIRDAGIRCLIDEGWLAKFHQYLLNDRWTPEIVAAMYLRDRLRWGKSVVFFLSLAECYRCAELLAQGGVRCDVVHGASDQATQIEAFNQDQLDVLLNVVVLTEGFDAPTLKTVFVRPGSKGPTIQMAGRALRKHAEKPFAQIVQNHETAWPFTKIASAESKFVYEDSQWQCRTSVSAKITAAHTNTLLVLASLDVKLPPFLKRHSPRKRRHRSEPDIT